MWRCPRSRSGRRCARRARATRRRGPRRRRVKGRGRMGTVRLGTNPIAWSNDDLPELGGETPLETCLAEAAAAGFSGIEKGNKFPNEAGALRAVLDRHGLAFVSGWYGAELRYRTVEQEVAAVRPHLELLR